MWKSASCARCSTGGSLPPAGAVRIEELINRYAYRYAQPPEGGPPIALSVEVATCPWNVNHRLARIALVELFYVRRLHAKFDSQLLENRPSLRRSRR